jgi:hypothetical protein
VVSAHGTFEATTDDVGGHGCQIVSPRLVRKGEPIQLVVSHECMKDPLRVAGRVAWASDRAPWRLGIAYDETAVPASQAWFDELLAHAPGLTIFRRIPDRIPLDAVVYLATPPRFLVDFTPDEVALLRSLGSGTSVAELRSLLRDRWDEALRALFSLLAHQHLTLARGASVHPDAWRKILSDAEASLAVEALRRAPVPEVRAAPGARTATPAPKPASGVPGWPAPLPRGAGAPFDPAPASPDAPDWLVSAAEMMPASWPAAAPSAPPAAPPPASPRGQARGQDGRMDWTTTPSPAPAAPAAAAAPTRAKEAQSCYERALVELQGGRFGGAMALLRRALALAPGDPEIAGALARMMKRG